MGKRVHIIIIFLFLCGLSASDLEGGQWRYYGKRGGKYYYDLRSIVDEGEGVVKVWTRHRENPAPLDIKVEKDGDYIHTLSLIYLDCLKRTLNRGPSYYIFEKGRRKASKDSSQNPGPDPSMLEIVPDSLEESLYEKICPGRYGHEYTLPPGEFNIDVTVPRGKKKNR